MPLVSKNKENHMFWVQKRKKEEKIKNEARSLLYDAHTSNQLNFMENLFAKTEMSNEENLSKLHGSQYEAVQFVLTFLHDRRVLPINKHGKQGI